ncbi:putative bacterioferritin [Nitrospira japonica]|uniref:Putative bacterioferritin n=1 Tax=Nitrospira japonica TaxID=1325564 RepID=A0A1W1I0U5_9BACT|nr:ferritin-like domain-containing protein [Nitrospira japonica]SLM46628.1 putative bacterioferritin [Nitrospira japonica]
MKRPLASQSGLTDQEIQDAVDQGAVTKQYFADPQNVVSSLNRLRSTEITSYLQYKQHGYMAVSLLSPGLKGEFEAHAQQELAHADKLAMRIQQLGGVPIFDLQELAGKAAAIGIHPEQGATLTEMVIENLLLERRQVEAYTALIREIGDKDLVTRETLLGILAETETHASELADFLKRTSDER